MISDNARSGAIYWAVYPFIRAATGDSKSESSDRARIAPLKDSEFQ